MFVYYTHVRCADNEVYLKKNNEIKRIFTQGNHQKTHIIEAHPSQTHYKNM